MWIRVDETGQGTHRFAIGTNDVPVYRSIQPNYTRTFQESQDSLDKWVETNVLGVIPLNREYHISHYGETYWRERMEKYNFDWNGKPNVQKHNV